MKDFESNLSNQHESFLSFENKSQYLNIFRKKSFDNFRKQGLPSLLDEDWRFTDLSNFYRNEYKHLDSSDIEFDKNIVPKHIKSLDAHFIYVQDGKLIESPESELFEINDLSVFLEELSEDKLDFFLNSHSEKNVDFTYELNSAFIKDGIHLEIKKNTILDKPIILLNFYSSDLSHISTRNIIEVGALSEGQIIEYSFSKPDINFFLNKATSFYLSDSSNIEHLSVDESSKNSYIFSNIKINQNKNSNFTTDSILIGGRIYRNNVHPALKGEGANSNILGLYMSTNNQHMDNYMFVEHEQPNCGSRQLYKGLLKDESKGVFHGRILVHNAAQKTDAKQTNRNLLLSDKAQVDTKPQLEIYADDVKCTHGATTGQLDPEALYYLRARGIEFEKAKLIMIRSFTEELLEFIKSDFILNLHKKTVENWFIESNLAEME